MISSVLPALLRPLQRESYRQRARQGGWIPRPSDTPSAHAPGLDPDRLLVFGNGLAVGWGVRTHGLALTGQLARAVTALTGRGSDVEALASSDIDITNAAAALVDQPIGDFDAAVVVIGASDAFRLASPGLWQREMTALLDTLLAGLSPSAPVVVLGIPPISTVPFFQVKVRSRPDRWAERLNALTREVCQTRDRVRFVVAPPLPEQPVADADEVRYRAPEVFQAVARELAGHLAPLLDAAAVSESGRRAPRRPSRPASDATGPRPSSPPAPYLSNERDERFDRIVTMAQRVFGTQGAAFTLVDDTQHWHKAVVGLDVGEHPVDVSFCAATLADSRPFVVTDAWESGRGLTATPHRFYAGHPVEGERGTRIGVICVFDPEPRTPSPVELSFLRELAIELKHEVQLATVGAWPVDSGVAGAGPRRQGRAGSRPPSSEAGSQTVPA